MLNVELSRPIRLDCQVESEQKPTVAWYRNGIELTQQRYMYVHLTIKIIYMIYMYIWLFVYSASILHVFGPSALAVRRIISYCLSSRLFQFVFTVYMCLLYLATAAIATSTTWLLLLLL